MTRWLFVVLVIYTINISAQIIPSTVEDMEIEYQSNIRKSKINGVYIPQDIEEAISEIIRLSPPQSIERFKNGNEEEVVRKLHFGLGKWLAIQWNFDFGSRYSHYLKEMGVTYPDDMISFTLRSLHRHLNEVPMNIRERAQLLKKKRYNEYLKRVQSGEVLDSL